VTLTVAFFLLTSFIILTLVRGTLTTFLTNTFVSFLFVLSLSFSACHTPDSFLLPLGLCWSYLLTGICLPHVLFSLLFMFILGYVQFVEDLFYELLGFSHFPFSSYHSLVHNRFLVIPLHYVCTFLRVVL
jgi:hypothetical protein